MTSINEVWGIDQESISDYVSSKKSSEEFPVEQPKQQDKKNEELLKIVQSLLLEVNELRREQSQRCSIYMIMIGILFAILIMYIDRLNSNISMNRINRPFS